MGDDVNAELARLESDVALVEARAARDAERLALAFGLRCTVLDAAGLAQAEPALRHPLAGAVHWQDPWSVRDPAELVSAYAQWKAGQVRRASTYNSFERSQTEQAQRQQQKGRDPSPFVPGIKLQLFRR